MPLTVDSINGLTNESRRPGLSRPADPRFLRLTQLLFELQRANALQIQIERAKDNTETVVVGFPPVGISPDLAAKIVEARTLLHLVRPAQGYAVRYGGYSGKGEEIAISTRSMLQVMLELGVLAQVPEADVAGRSKLVFGSVMLLFSISDVGVRSAPPVVTVPAN